MALSLSFPTAVGDLTSQSRRVLPYVLTGLLAAQLHLAIAAEPDLSRALAAGLKWALASWLAAASWSVTRELLSPSGRAADDASTDVALGDINVLRGAARARALRTLAAGALLITAALLRSPSRLAVNLLGFGMLAVPLCWVVQRRAGWPAAAHAATIVTVIAFFPTHLDGSIEPKRLSPLPASPFNWSVTWPGLDWRLRHAIPLDEPWPDRPARISVMHAAPYGGPASVLATVNGQEAGALQDWGNGYLGVEISAARARGQHAFVIELRVSQLDPGLRILAQRWTGGAAARDSSSAYFDGDRWQQGTFSDLLGRTQPGIHLISVAAP